MLDTSGYTLQDPPFSFAVLKFKESCYGLQDLRDEIIERKLHCFYSYGNCLTGPFPFNVHF